MDCVYLNKTYDINPIIEEISRIPEKFKYAHQGSPEWWFGVPLRNASGTNDESGLRLNHTLSRRNGGMAECQNSLILENEMPRTLEIIRDLEKITEVHLVRLLILKANGKINPHRDGNIFGRNGKIYRLHLPIITNENVIFEIMGREYRMEVGKLYFADVSKSHSVINAGNEDRIHLVIDVKVNESIKNLLDQTNLLN